MTYRSRKVPILDQGTEGACTGFGLATVVHYLLRTRQVVPDRNEVSPRMLYDMARRYDEWPGEKYDGSSARGAMKGWHKHGVCSSLHWQYTGKQDPKRATRSASRTRCAGRSAPTSASTTRTSSPCTAAIAEVGILYATAQVHEGWNAVGADGIVEWSDGTKCSADTRSPSWPTTSAGSGFRTPGAPTGASAASARSPTTTGWPTAATSGSRRLGAPIELRARDSVAYGVGVASQGRAATCSATCARTSSALATTASCAPMAPTARPPRTWPRSSRTSPGSRRGRQRLLLYAHGGLTPEDSAVQRVADLRGPLLDAGVYPLSLVWKTDFWTTLSNILQDAVAKRRPEGFLDATKDFMLDRLDDALEPLARVIGGRAQWERDEGERDARQRCRAARGARAKVATLKAKVTRRSKIHMVGHSAGSILLGGLLAAMTRRAAGTGAGDDLHVVGAGLHRGPLSAAVPAGDRSGQLKRFGLFTLTDKAERDDHCANIYHKSLLYLVSNAFETRLAQTVVPVRRDGEPILGMEKFVQAAAGRRAARRLGARRRTPSRRAARTRRGRRPTARSTTIQATLQATLARILNKSSSAATFVRHRSGSSNRARRAVLAQ